MRLVSRGEGIEVTGPNVASKRLLYEEDKSVELPTGYELDAAGTNLLLKRPRGFVIAAFGEGVKKDSIRHVAEADERYLRAIQRQENFGSAADSETVLMFAADIREARTEFLLTLEALYCGEDVPPPTMVLLLRSLQGSTALARCEARTGLRLAPPAARSRNT